jgi:glycogen phosphorylase
MPARRTRNLSLRRDVAHLDQLAELALDLRSTWNHRADEIWSRLDSELWGLTHNPWIVLQTVARGELRRALADSGFRRRVNELVETARHSATAPRWFQKTHGGTDLSRVAYFCMEFMLSEALPIYSGGLGNVAGDQLKAADDLGVPVVGVGLLYQQGNFRQVIDASGAQQAFYPYNDPGQLPVTPLRARDGSWLRLQMPLPGYPVWLRTWQAQVGQTRLYLLDSNDAANFPPHRGITGELYGGPPEMRLKQELVLGIGGWRLLEALGARPEVCHMNEGHAAFAVLERARQFMRDAGVPFDVALTATRAGNLFTTHTPVAAGFDRFAPALITEYLGAYAERELGVSQSDLLALGRARPDDATEPFNMAYLAVHGSGAVSAVSRLHATVSRRIFQPLFPRWPEVEVPVSAVTNGIHTPSWDSAEADALWTQAASKDRWRGALEGLEDAIRAVPDSVLWQMRNAARASLVEYVRTQFARQLAASGARGDEIERANRALDGGALTLGFARRFTGYKRPTLLLHDAARLLRILTDRDRPVYLIVAGKAHPADTEGRAMVQEWATFMRRPETQGHVVFLADDDMQMTERLVQGVDVWINTPRRPWEACGTSGMKTLVNGGLNFSELDGWWAEAYAPDVGWALGDRREHGDDAAWDAAEATALYGVLEHEIVPDFHARGPDGIPRAWIARVRESMARLTPRFSSNRAVREYTANHYLPAAAAYRARSADEGALARAVTDWRRNLARSWSGISLAPVAVASQSGRHEFAVEVDLNGIAPDTVAVELYADGRDGGVPERYGMTRLAAVASAPTRFRFEGQAPGARPASDYTVRVVPRYGKVPAPLEAPWIRWAERE